MKKAVFISLFMVLFLASLAGGQWSVANAQGSIPPAFIPVTGLPIITAGLGHSCMTYGNQVICWGLNSSGQDGNGTFVDQHIPVFVKDLTGVVDLTSGSLFTCALTGDGLIYCWGDNTYGQLGNGTTVNSNVPVLVKDLPGKAISFTGGLDFTCAQLENLDVYCWGKNDTGQLNDGTTTNRSTPVKSKLEKVQTNISGGQTVLLGESYGDVAQWKAMQEAGVSNLDLSMSISANRWGAGGCAVTADGVVECWTGDLKSAAVNQAPTAVLVATAMEHGCALNANSTVSCWGDNQYGELGNGNNVSNSSAVSVKDLADAYDLAAGRKHNCALLGDGIAKCWGSNEFGQLGNNSTTDSSIPVLVLPPVQ